MFVIKLFEIGIALADAFMGNHPNNIISVVVRSILHLSVFIVVQLINIILMINQRQNEYNADDFSFKNGYGSDLTESLYILRKIDLGGKISLLERLKSSHPNIDDRISRLEEKIEV